MNLVKKLIPLPVKRNIRNYLNERDREKGKRQLFGRAAPLIPSAEEMLDGQGTLEEFKRNGEEFLKIYRDRCGLRPDERMLDVGCGFGCKTWPLTEYFNSAALYHGLDVTASSIEWLRQHYTPWFPNFQFELIDVYNKYYNPRGQYRADEYQFPFADESFSFVMLGSVFTHMLPEGVDHYLAEICRVLRKGGRCLITYFLLNPESVRLINQGSSTIDFKYVFDRYRIVSQEVPEKIIAYDEAWVRDQYARLGLKISQLDYGSWCGRENHLSYQDLILAVKGHSG